MKSAKHDAFSIAPRAHKVLFNVTESAFASFLQRCGKQPPPQMIKTKHIDFSSIAKFKDAQRTHSVIPASELFNAVHNKLQEFSLPVDPLGAEDTAAILRVYVHFGHADSDVARFLSEQLLNNVSSLHPRAMAMVFAACVEHVSKQSHSVSLGKDESAAAAAAAAASSPVLHQTNEGASTTLPTPQQQDGATDGSTSTRSSRTATNFPLAQLLDRVRFTANQLRHHEIVMMVQRLGEVAAVPSEPSSCGGRDLISYASSAAELVAALLPHLKQRLPRLMPLQLGQIALGVLPAVSMLGTRPDVTDFFFLLEQRLSLYAGEIDEQVLVKIVSMMNRRGLGADMLVAAMRQHKEVEQSLESAPDVQEILQALSAFGGNDTAARTARTSARVQQVYLARAVKMLSMMDVGALQQLLQGLPSAAVAAANADEENGTGTSSSAADLLDDQRSPSATSSSSSSASGGAASNGNNVSSTGGDNDGAVITVHTVVVEVLNRLNHLLQRASSQSTVSPLPLRETLKVLRATAVHFKSLGPPPSAALSVAPMAAGSFSSSSSSSQHNIITSGGGSNSFLPRVGTVRVLLQRVAARAIKLALTEASHHIEALPALDVAQLTASLRYVQPPTADLRSLVDRLVQRGLRGRFGTVTGQERVLFVCLLGKVPLHAGALLQEAIRSVQGLQSELLQAVLQPSAAMALLCGLCQLQDGVSKDIFVNVAKKTIENPVFPIGAGQIDSVVELTSAMVQYKVVFPSLVSGLLDAAVGCAGLCSTRDVALLTRNFATLGVREPAKLRKLAEVVLMEKPPSMANTANVLMALCLTQPDSPLVAQCCARVRVNAHTATVEESVQILHALSLLKGDALFNNPGNIAAVTAALEHLTGSLHLVKKIQSAMKQQQQQQQQQQNQQQEPGMPQLPRVPVQVLSTMLNAVGVLQRTMLVPSQLQNLLSAVGSTLPALIEAMSSPSSSSSSSPTSASAETQKQKRQQQQQQLFLESGVAPITASQTVQLWSLLIMRLQSSTPVKNEAVEHLFSALRADGSAVAPGVLSSVAWALAEPMPLVGIQANEAVMLLQPLLCSARSASQLTGQQAIVALCSLRGLGMPLDVAEQEPLLERIVATERQWCTSRDMADRLTRIGAAELVSERLERAKVKQHLEKEKTTADAAADAQQQRKKSGGDEQQQQQQQEHDDLSLAPEGKSSDSSVSAPASNIDEGGIAPSPSTSKRAGAAKSFFYSEVLDMPEDPFQQVARKLQRQYQEQTKDKEVARISNIELPQQQQQQQEQEEADDYRLGSAPSVLAAATGTIESKSQQRASTAVPQQQQQQQQQSRPSHHQSHPNSSTAEPSLSADPSTVAAAAASVPIPNSMKGFTELCAIGGEEKVPISKRAPVVPANVERQKKEAAAAAAATAATKREKGKKQNVMSVASKKSPTSTTTSSVDVKKNNAAKHERSVSPEPKSSSNTRSKSSSSTKAKKTSPKKSLKATIVKSKKRK